MKLKLETISRTSRMDKLVKASTLYAAAKFPDRRPKVRETKKAEILTAWKDERKGFKIGDI